LAYAVEADLNLSDARLVELTDSEAAPGVSDSALLARLEAEAEGIVDAYLAGSVPVPFTAPIPAIITAITAWIWAYRIYRHREVMDIPKSVSDDYAMALALLEKIAAGGSAAVGVPSSLSPGVPSVETAEPRGWTPRDEVES
jgi:phage gp36-like protein